VVAGPTLRTCCVGLLSLAGGCATSGPATAPLPATDSDSVASRTPSEPSPSDDPCASTLRCVDRAEARADIEPLRAEAELEACLACPDASPSGYRLLADLARGRDDRPKARRVLRAGHRRFPESGSLALSLARLERDDGNVQAALTLFAQAARAHPRDEIIAREHEAMLARHGTEAQRREAAVKPLLREAVGRFELGDVDGARQTLRLALKRTEGLADLRARIHHRLALIELSEGRYDAAAQQARRGRSLEPGDRALRFELALALSEIRMAEGRWEPALQATRAALALEHENPLAWANRALCHAALNDLDRAIEAFESAVDRGLSRRLTYAQLESLGMPFERLSSDPRFDALVARGWPGRAEPQAR